MTDLRQLADRGHALTIDSGWRDVADAALNWLTAPQAVGLAISCGPAGRGNKSWRHASQHSRSA